MRPATIAALIVSIFVAIFLPMLLSGIHWRTALNQARRRRMADHRMNARLLRFDI